MHFSAFGRPAVSFAAALVMGAAGILPVFTAGPVAAVVSSPNLPRSAPGRLAYSTGIYVADETGQSMGVKGLGTIGLDGSDQRTLSEPPEAGYDHSPQWSPDGNWLAYLQSRPLPESGVVDAVALMPRDGGEPQIVDAHGRGPTWSPDGRHLAWVSTADDGSFGIGIADVETTATSITLTQQHTLKMPDPTKFLGSPIFSPDGQSLAFVVGNYFTRQAVLHTISTTGENLQQISHNVAIEVGNNNYSFSPDGTKLLFQADTDESPGAVKTYVVDSDGTDQQRISPVQLSTDAAAWAPTGDMIAMTTSSPLQGIRLFDVTGEFLGSLASDIFNVWGGLTFSPDGATIYSVASPYDSGPDHPWAPDLYAIPTNGDEPQRLTTDHSVFPTTVQAIDPGRVLRQFGDDAVATAAAAVARTAPPASSIVVSPVDDYAATLTAAPLAAKLHAPAVVSRTATLSREVLATAHRMHATHAVLVGALSARVAGALEAAGLSVSRVANTASPYRASVAVASRLKRHSAYLVPLGARTSGEWKLALATAGSAAFERKPLLYTQHAALPKTTKKAIRRLDIASVTIVGDNNDVKTRLLQQLKNLGVRVQRIRSSDQYEISALLAQRAQRNGARTDHPVVASGASWTSSVSAPALAALLGQTIVLVDNRNMKFSRPTANWLRQHRVAIRTATLLGGVNVLKPRVEAQLEGRI